MNKVEYDFAMEVEREIEKREDVIAEYEVEMKEKNIVIQEKDTLIQEMSQQKRLGIKNMLKANLDIETIAEFSSLTIKEVQQYITEIEKEI